MKLCSDRRVGVSAFFLPPERQSELHSTQLVHVKLPAAIARLGRLCLLANEKQRGHDRLLKCWFCESSKLKYQQSFEAEVRMVGMARLPNGSVPAVVNNQVGVTVGGLSEL